MPGGPARFCPAWPLGPGLRGQHLGEGHAGKFSWLEPLERCAFRRRGGGWGLGEERGLPGLKGPEDPNRTGGRAWHPSEGTEGLAFRNKEQRENGQKNAVNVSNAISQVTCPPHPCQSPASPLLPTVYLLSGPAPRERASPPLLNHRVCANLVGPRGLGKGRGERW